MMNGQKVVKVFCHEEENMQNFKKLNDELYVSADKANTFANFCDRSMHRSEISVM